MKRTSSLETLFKTLASSLSIATLNSIRLLTKISTKITMSRIDKKMNQTQFAKFMGVSQGMISKWESGDYNFTIKQLCEICEKLELTPNIEFQSQNSATEYTPRFDASIDLRKVENGQAKLTIESVLEMAA